MIDKYEATATATARMSRSVSADAVPAMYEAAPSVSDDNGVTWRYWRVTYVYHPVDARGARVWTPCGASATVQALSLEDAVFVFNSRRPCNSHLVSVSLVFDGNGGAL